MSSPQAAQAQAESHPSLVLFIGQRNYSSWSLRPWLLLRQLGIAFEERRVHVAGQGFNPALHGAHSPSGVVPVLHGPAGLRVWDSLAICEWAAEQAPGYPAWPADARARATARSLAAEMHAGFAAVRAALPFNIKFAMPRGAAVVLDEAAAAQVARLEAAWAGARREFGSCTSHPFLFGVFGAVDAMFAPIAFRFQTYGVRLADGDAAAYAAALLALPAMREWETAALAEADPLSHYDAMAVAAGAVLRTAAPQT